MNTRTVKYLAAGLAVSLFGGGCANEIAQAQSKSRPNPASISSAKVAYPQKNNDSPTPKVVLSAAEWRKRMDANVFEVTREAGTERAGSHPYHNLHDKGVFQCSACGLILFTSDTKFDSGTGWPSFYAPAEKNRVIEKQDNQFGWKRTEVLCARCDSHLGHVFEDGPKPTGLRYCMNGVSLVFVPTKK